MLNFSIGLKSLEASCIAAGITTIVTSRLFVETAKLEEIVAALGKGRSIVWTEDVRGSIGFLDKMKGMAKARMARRLAGASVSPDAIAVMLFTSGTEGLPKGVALTHTNLLSNCAQFSAHVDLGSGQKVFAALPIFHSFGLTTGLIAPIVLGLGTFLYPSPLHYRQIPDFIAKAKARIVVATDTFASGWGRLATKAQFASLSPVVLGAERVKETTRTLFREKFGLELLEGYGATECAPVIAANQPWDNRPGSVGRMMPGIAYRLEPVQGLSEGGRLHVRGPNIMAGYMTVDAPGTLRPPAGGWHDTGDINADGVVTIKGRAKRFAKIGGEMVSLAAVEAYVSAVWPDNAHAVVALPDPRKGETLVLVTDHDDADMSAVIAWARDHGVAELMIPKRVVTVESLPVLGTGKTDYISISQLAAQA